MIGGTLAMRDYEFYKPNVGAMHGSWGNSIMETIKNTPPIDYAAMKAKADEYEKAILELKKNGK